MTPEERRALADALDRDADHLDSRVGWQKYQSDADAYRARAARARQAAAVLREQADAVVIPRSAIPDDLPGDLMEMAEEVSAYRRALGDHDRLATAARLLSGGATEGRTSWPEEET